MGAETRDAEEALRRSPEPGEHRVRLRAYEIWEAEGRPEGKAVDHWLRARWELKEAPEPKAELEALERELAPERKPE